LLTRLIAGRKFTAGTAGTAGISSTDSLSALSTFAAPIWSMLWRWLIIDANRGIGVTGEPRPLTLHRTARAVATAAAGSY
jgi:hypothetical protein